MKQLVAAGAGSRRRAAALIMAGRVSVNGGPALALGAPVCAGDVVTVDGEPLAEPDSRRVYLLLNKPKGYLSAVGDSRGRPTVLDLVPPGLRAPGLVPVGRLDLDSTGLMLLTNDGGLVHRVTHPRYGVEKEYDVLLDRALLPRDQRRLVEGVETEAGRARAVSVDGVSGPAPRYRVVLIEGKKREVRLMMSEVGRRVVQLARVRIGGLELGGLQVGALRQLSESDAKRTVAAAKRAQRG